jgi:hypothetical protein
MFEALIDYAGLFPPAHLPMGAAVEEYLQARDGRFAPMLGRFIVPASRISELLPLATTAIPVSIIVDAGSDPRTWLARASEIAAQIGVLRNDGRLLVEALEVPLPPLLSMRDSYDASIGQWAALNGRGELRGIPSYLELPRDARLLGELSGAMAALARHRLGAKVRCGSVTGDAPAPRELAIFVRTAASENVPFKATAGLHHAVRHFNPQAGYTMHGFLNLLAAAAHAEESVDAIEAMLAAENDEAFRALSPERVREARRRFVAYGSCSFTEPVADLIALGLLQQNA